MTNKIEDLRTKFRRIYANLPLAIRKDIIAVMDKQPMTWFVCWLEIDQKTEKGDEILEYLDRLQLI